jgi:hypothetical protein
LGDKHKKNKTKDQEIEGELIKEITLEAKTKKALQQEEDQKQEEELTFT